MDDWGDELVDENLLLTPYVFFFFLSSNSGDDCRQPFDLDANVPENALGSYLFCPIHCCDSVLHALVGAISGLSNIYPGCY